MKSSQYFTALLFVLVLSACSDGVDPVTPSTVIGTSDTYCADSSGKEIPCK